MALLAIPVVLDHLGSMSMPFVDTIMVGRLGPEELGAVGAAAAVYSVYMVFANGIISSVSPTVAHAFGAREDEEIGRAAGQGFWLVLGLALLGWIVTWNMEGLMSLTGQDPEVASLAGQYIRALSAGIPASQMPSVLKEPLEMTAPMSAGAYVADASASTRSRDQEVSCSSVRTPQRLMTRCVSAPASRSRCSIRTP